MMWHWLPLLVGLAAAKNAECQGESCAVLAGIEQEADASLELLQVKGVSQMSEMTEGHSEADAGQKEDEAEYFVLINCLVEGHRNKLDLLCSLFSCRWGGLFLSSVLCTLSTRILHDTGFGFLRWAAG